MQTKTFTASATFPIDLVVSFASSHWRINPEEMKEIDDYTEEQIQKQPDVDTFISNLIKNNLMDFLWKPTVNNIAYEAQKAKDEQIAQYKKELEQSIFISTT